MANVTVIPATRDIHTRRLTNVTTKRKVAGYARVSTDNEEQLTSYEAQVDYYTGYIKANPQWEFAGVYTDEGISATNTKRREGFNRMVADALAGKIDLIVTKSVSRFARNTVDSLTTVRKLKDHGTEVYFEKENIYTFDSKGELLITIMSSLAQEESRSISENVTWGHRKRFADGKYSMSYKNFLGYEKGEGKDAPPVINKEQAKTVEEIYRLFLKGKTPLAIAEHLTAKGIPTPGGKKKWTKTTITSILTNEKYKGDALLQKTFTVDFLQKKHKKNEGEVQQYYVENCHEAIIEPDVWDMVQHEMERRKTYGSSYSGNSLFASRLVCGECGSFYGTKVWHSNDKYRRTIYQCNGKFKNGTKCTTRHFTEEEIKALFIKAFNKIFSEKDRLIEDCKLAIESLTDYKSIDEEIKNLLTELDVISEMITRCIEENSRNAQNQEEYLNRYNSYVEKYDKTKARFEALQKERNERASKANVMTSFLKELEETTKPIQEFDDTLWRLSIEKVIVQKGGIVKFIFAHGEEIEVAK